MRIGRPPGRPRGRVACRPIPRTLRATLSGGRLPKPMKSLRKSKLTRRPSLLGQLERPGDQPRQLVGPGDPLPQSARLRVGERAGRQPHRALERHPDRHRGWEAPAHAALWVGRSRRQRRSCRAASGSSGGATTSVSAESGSPPARTTATARSASRDNARIRVTSTSAGAGGGGSGSSRAGARARRARRKRGRACECPRGGRAPSKERCRQRLPARRAIALISRGSG